MSKTRQDYLTLVKMTGSPYADQTSSEYMAFAIQVSNFRDECAKMYEKPWTINFYNQWYNNHLIQIEKFNDLKKKISKDTHLCTGLKWYFVTVGYDDKNITPNKMRMLGDKLQENKEYKNMIYVHEKYRKDLSGNIYIHHHTHFLFECDLSKSRIIDRFFATVKKSVVSKNFIDVKGYKDNCGSYEQKVNYIEGNKIESKMECCRMDDIWRLECGLFRKL